MKRLLLIVLLSAIPHSISVALGNPDSQTVVTGATDPAVVDGDGVVWVGDDGKVTVGAANGAYVYTVAAEAKTEDGRSEGAKGAKTIQVRRIGDGRNRAWLGVSIDGVPEAMADQLNIGDQGVLVVNVAKDSPADHAGIEAHDVILSIGGDAVSGDVSNAVKLIASRAPGDNVKVVVLREGKEDTLTVTLGSVEGADLGAIHWKFEGEPEARIEDEVKTRGRMIFRGPKGEWIAKELGELDELKDLPDSVRMLVPKSGRRVMKFSNSGDTKTIEVQVERDGSTVVIDQKDGGEITVHRTDKDGQEEAATYADADELKSSDKEAYKLYKKAGKTANIELHLKGLDDLDDLDSDFTLDFDMDLSDEQWKEHVDEWRDQLDESFGAAQEAYEKAMQEFHETMKQLQKEKGLPPVEFFHAAPDADHEPGVFAFLGKPRHTFEVRSDGTIEVRIRKGDSELVQLFDNEDDLAQRAPDLYEKYDELMSQDPE